MGELGWDTNYWDFKAPRVHAPEPKARVPKPVPEPERLFTIQKHMLDMLHLLRDPKAEHHLERIEAIAENTYRVINTYLRTNVQPSQGGDIS